MESTTTSSNVQGVNLDHTSHIEMETAHHEDITEGNPANDITMMSLMSASSNDPEMSMTSIKDVSMMSVCTEISMKSLHDISMMSLGSESSNDSQIAIQSIYKNLQKIQKKLLQKKRALNTHQVTPV